MFSRKAALKSTGYLCRTQAYDSPQPEQVCITMNYTASSWSITPFDFKPESVQHYNSTIVGEDQGDLKKNLGQ